MRCVERRRIRQVLSPFILVQAAAIASLIGQVAAATGQDARSRPPARRSPAATEAPDDEAPGAIASSGEVRIGWFGPSDAGDADAGDMWAGAVLAIDEANAAGGYRGMPFRLLPAWSENPWGTGVSDLARLVYEDDVRAIVGAPDGPSAHLVAQIVAKARLPFVSPVATDRTANRANVPWIFSCAPSDEQMAPLLAEAAVKAGNRRVVLISCTDHDSRMLAAELREALADRNAFPSLHLEFQPGQAARLPVEAVRDGSPGVIVLAAGPGDSAEALCLLRNGGIAAPVVGGPAMGHRGFRFAAAGCAQDVTHAALWDASRNNERALAFRRRFVDRHGREPDCTAVLAYDAVSMLVAAIHTGGLDREAIRDALVETAPFAGVAGRIEWDDTGQNVRPAGLRVAGED